MTTIQRTTQEIITPNGHKVVTYDYLTGGEMRKLTAFYLDGINASDITTQGGANKMLEKVSASTLFKAQELALSLLIVSVDGETENAFEKCMALRDVDLDAVINKIDLYTSQTTLPKKNE